MVFLGGGVVVSSSPCTYHLHHCRSDQSFRRLGGLTSSPAGLTLFRTVGTTLVLGSGRAVFFGQPECRACRSHLFQHHCLELCADPGHRPLLRQGGWALARRGRDRPTSSWLPVSSSPLAGPDRRSFSSWLIIGAAVLLGCGEPSSVSSGGHRLVVLGSLLRTTGPNLPARGRRAHSAHGPAADRRASGYVGERWYGRVVASLPASAISGSRWLQNEIVELCPGLITCDKQGLVSSPTRGPGHPGDD